jgi:hypothetical protein
MGYSDHSESNLLPPNVLPLSRRRTAVDCSGLFGDANPDDYAA